MMPHGSGTTKVILRRDGRRIGLVVLASAHKA
jgi:hypothetical protein